MLIESINWSKIPCLVISTPNNEERKENVLNECKKVGLNPILIEAIMIKENPVKGCLESHLKCIRYAKEKKYKKVLILEDDIVFKKELQYINIWMYLLQIKKF